MVIDHTTTGRFIAAHMAFLGTLVSDEEKHGDLSAGYQALCIEGCFNIGPDSSHG